MHRVLLFSFVLGLSSWLCSWPAPQSAAAQDAVAQDADDARARRYFEAGSTRYQDGDYEGAISDFERAFELSHRSGLLYNLYLTHERLAQLEEAAEYLRRYLDSDSAIEDRDQLLVRLQNLRDRIAQANAPATRTNEQLSSDEGWPTGAWISFGVGAAGVATFAVFATLAFSENGSLADRCGSNAGRVCTDDDVAGLRRNALIADIGLGVAAAGVLSGLLFLLLDGDDEDETAAPAVAILPWFTHQSGGANVRLSL